MRTTNPLAVHVAPIFLRIALAITFAWSGLAKIQGHIDVQGEQAATLANLGVIVQTTQPPPGTQSPVNVPPEEAETSALPSQTAPAIVFVQNQSGDEDQAGQRTEEEVDPGAAGPPPAAGVYRAEDFPDPIRVRRMHSVTLAVHNAAFPETKADGTTPPPYWPMWAADGSKPVMLAWLASLTELLAAVLLLIGFLSRLSGLAIAGVMVTAAWLTQIGPTVQEGNTVLGFLPGGRTWHAPADWSTLLWQLALFCMGLSMLFCGAGGLSIDRAVWSKSDRDEFEEEEREESEQKSA